MKQITFLIFLLSFTLSSYAQDLRITEIMYNPSNTDSRWEWVEVYNAGNQLIDLEGYIIDDNAGAAYSEANISSGNILPGQSAILFNASALSESDFIQEWGTVSLIPVTRWSALNNGGDTIGIWNSFEAYSGDNKSQENVIEQVKYEADGEIWPEDDGAASIFLVDLDADNTIGMNWSLSALDGVTPLFKTYASTVNEANDGRDIGSPGLPGAILIEKPIITCPEDISILSDENNCEAKFLIVPPTSTDNLSATLQFVGIRNDGLDLIDSFPIGETIITWTAEDETGNISENCIQKVVVLDEVKPMINCLDTIQASSPDGSPILLDVALVEVNDFCDDQPILIWSRSDEKELQAPFSVGVTQIIWTAIDASGNEAECTQMVIVSSNASMQKDITSFSLPNQLTDVSIDEQNKTIVLKVPFGTAVDALAPLIEISEDASVIPESGIAQDFSNSIEYVVTAQDGSKQIWTVSVEIEEESEPEIEVNSFMLINADSDEDLFLITEGMIINLDELPTTNLDIRANFTAAIESVRLSLDGMLKTSRVENVAPYALFGDSPIGDYNGTTFIAGAYIVSATPYSEDNLGGDLGTVLTLNFEFFTEVEIAVTDFMLVNADTNEDLFILTEGMQIDQNSLPTLNLDIRANTIGLVESVRLRLEGDMEQIRTENHEPYALYGDSPIGIYNGKQFTAGTYKISATPFLLDRFNGEEGTSLSVNFEILPPAPILVITGFTLINADTNEDIMDLNDGIQIDLSELPTSNLNVRANTTDDVESVHLSLATTLDLSRIENVVPYALFGDFPAGNYKGATFEVGDYVISALGYAKLQLGGKLGESLSISFEIIDTELSGKSVSQMNIYPNPASNATTVEFESAEVLKVIYLYDLIGRVVGVYEGSKVESDGEYILNVDSVPEGAYYINFRDERGILHQKQMVIKK